VVFVTHHIEEVLPVFTQLMLMGGGIRAIIARKSRCVSSNTPRLRNECWLASSAASTKTYLWRIEHLWRWRPDVRRRRMRHAFPDDIKAYNPVKYWLARQFN